MIAYACDDCARYLGRMRGSSLHRCMDHRAPGSYVPVSPPLLSDGQDPADACAGWTRCADWVRFGLGGFCDGVQ